MRKIKIGLVILSLTASIGLISTGLIFADSNPLQGKIIALDAGHGGGETGAVNQKYDVAEADVNLSVVNALKLKLEGQQAYVVVTERYSTRRDRVNDAVAKCAALDVTGDGVADNKKCDVLVSVHHNGSSDPNHDGTLTIYTQNSDKPLAKSLHDTLLLLTNKDEGMLNGGYGMTVYKNIVSAITEAYYITNDCEAELYLYSTGQLTDTSQSCKDSGYQAVDRINQEADAQVAGLSNYFSAPPQKPGNRK
ncbi:MAG: N-acetylmuramoyl-L-alanine amidase [bacterium]|nr:N-acetylmuramoyl-L-alanine amidase [bacterium]